MRCPKCGFNNNKRMNFCGNCGSPLYVSCPECGHRNPTQLKLCEGCGTTIPFQRSQNTNIIERYIPSYLVSKLIESGGELEPERRMVTVLFADISGFTAMSEALDPEDVLEVLNAYHSRLGKIISRNKGIVDKIVGDGIMAIFGISSHENDAELAILTAMEMQSAVNELSREFGKSSQPALGLSIGINTGIAVIGNIGAEQRLDYSAIGDVVNTTYRIEEKAKAGEILVSHETFTRTKHAFDFEKLGAMSVKGKSKPVLVYKVLGKKYYVLDNKGVEGLRSQLIGRAEEYEACKQIVDMLYREGLGGYMLITGEAGIGKSRLANEIKAFALSLGIRWIEGRCSPDSSSINYSMFIDALRRYFAIEPSDNLEDVRSKVSRKFQSHDESILTVITELVSVGLVADKSDGMLSEEEKRFRIFIGLRKFLSSDATPTIVMFDDIHWADEKSLQLLVFLIKELPQNVLFLCLSRPMTSEGQDPVQVLREVQTFNRLQLALKPLSYTDIGLLFDSLLYPCDVDVELKRTILEKSAGNPFFLEEIIRNLIDAQIILKTNDKWCSVKDPEGIAVPSNIQDLIMSRIDKLDTISKTVLQCASVIGRSFETQALLNMIKTLVRHDRKKVINSPSTSLKVLADRGFIHQEDVQKDVFSFRHVLIQEAVYSTISLKRRKLMHLFYAQYIEENYSRQLDDFYELLAHHYERGGDPRTTALYLIKSGNKARRTATGSVDRALNYFQKALGIFESQIGSSLLSLRQELHMGLGETYRDLGDLESSLREFRTLLSLAEESNNLNLKAEALRQIGNLMAQIGDWESSLKAYIESLETAQRSGNLLQVAFALNCIGLGYLERGFLDLATECFERAYQIGAELDDARLMGDISNSVATLASMRNKLDDAVKHYHESLRCYKSIGEEHYEAQVYQNLGITYLKKGDLDLAERYYDESLKIAERHNYMRLKIYNYLSKAEIHLLRSNLNDAITFCEEASTLLGILNEPLPSVESRRLYGLLFLKQGDIEKAKEYFYEGLEISSRYGYIANSAEIHREIATAYEREQEFQRAIEHLDEARKLFQQLKMEEELKAVERHLDRLRLRINQ